MTYDYKYDIGDKIICVNPNGYAGWVNEGDVLTVSDKGHFEGKRTYGFEEDPDGNTEAHWLRVGKDYNFRPQKVKNWKEILQ